MLPNTYSANDPIGSHGGNIIGSGGATAAANFATNGSPSATPTGGGAVAIAGGTNRTYAEALLKTCLLYTSDAADE